MIIRVAICPSEASITIPSKFQDILAKSNKNERVTLAEIIDRLPNTHKEITDSIKLDFYIEGFGEDSWYIKSKDKFVFKERLDTIEMYRDIEIVEVDTSRKWMISEGEHCEYINYFETPKLVDEEINLYSY